MIKALGNKVVLKIPDTSKTESGIHLPDGVKKDNYIVVESVGEDVKLPLKKGDNVVCLNDPTKVIATTIKGVKYIFAEESCVCALVED